MQRSPPTATERLPFAIQALIDRPGGLPALGAGDWRAAREAVRLFYFERQFAPAWTDASGFNAAGRSAWARIAAAGEDGLDLKALILPAADFSTADSDKLAEADAELSVAIAVYALEASGARIKPTSISPYVTAHADVVDPAAALADGRRRRRSRRRAASVQPAAGRLPTITRKIVAAAGAKTGRASSRTQRRCRSSARALSRKLRRLRGRGKMSSPRAPLRTP